MIKKSLRYIFRTLRFLIRLNILKTLYINFRVLPLGQAIKLPIYLFGKIKIYSLSGSIEINAPIQKGMIKIGYRWIDLFPSSLLPTQINVTGRLTFEGFCVVSGGVALIIQNRQAECNIGNNVSIGGGTIIKSLDKLAIGDFSRITGNCTIMNSNMHYVKNIQTGVVHKAWGQITIGSYCWINSGTTITKGTIVPDYSVVARGSFLNKDYSRQGANALIVGAPAKIISNYSQRIFNLKKQEELNTYFREHLDMEFYEDEVGLFKETDEKVF